MDFLIDKISGHNAYKMLAAVVVPRPIAFVTTLSETGVVNAAPFSFFNLLGSSPPTVGLGIAPASNGQSKDTLRNIEQTKEFVVHLVHESLVDQMNVGAIDFPLDVSEVTEAGLHLRPASAISIPVISDALVHLECVLDQVVRTGNNSIVLGRIVAFGIDDHYLDAENLHVDTPALHLIGRMHGAGWYTRTNDLFELSRISLDRWKSRT